MISEADKARWHRRRMFELHGREKALRTLVPRSAEILEIQMERLYQLISQRPISTGKLWRAYNQRFFPKLSAATIRRTGRKLAYIGRINAEVTSKGPGRTTLFWRLR